MMKWKIINDDSISAMKVFIIPGNGSGDVTRCNWYPWAQNKIQSLEGIQSCVLQNMPDPLEAKRSVWLPFMEQELNIGAEDIIIGHSSGAVAAIRYAETHKVAGLVLVSAYSSHLGDQLEKASGYFDGDWLYEDVIRNCRHIIQFGSTDDPFLPWDSQKEIADGLKADLRKYDDKGHFQNSVFPELISAIKDIAAKSNQ